MQFLNTDRYTHAHARKYYVHMEIDTIVSIRTDRYIHARARIYYVHMEIDTIVSTSMDRYIHARYLVARRAFGRAACSPGRHSVELRARPEGIRSSRVVEGQGA